MEEGILSIRNAVLRRGTVAEGFSIRISELSLQQGELLAILGPSGCGKSTLLDMIGLILPPVSAEAFDLDLGGGRLFRSLHRAREQRLMTLRRRHFGYILQSGGLIASITVRENILTAVRFSDRSLDQGRFSMLVDALGLGGLLSRKPRELSGGQRQRVAIARALIHNPQMVLADEPTAAIDHNLAQEVCGVLRDCAKQLHTTVAMVTHNRELAVAFADRILDLGASHGSPVSRI